MVTMSPPRGRAWILSLLYDSGKSRHDYVPNFASAGNSAPRHEMAKLVANQAFIIGLYEAPV
jgi:hypothetical protein